MNPEFTQRVKDANNIHEVIGEYMSLKRAGINYKGCCPFHGEKTPSFVVSPNKNMYKCFGCGVGGDVIKFVQDHEQISFNEAIKMLAKRAAIEVPEIEMTSEDRQRMLERESLLNVNVSAWGFYRQNLMNNRTAMAYVLKRGYSQDTINAFGMGFAESTNQLLSTLPASQKEYARKLSLLKKGEHGEYDTFRNRIMFAFQDMNGNVLGFTGRHIDWKKGDNFPKFLNSDDSQLFRKEKVVFGLFQAKKEIMRMDKVFQVEGQGDVVSMYQNSLKNTVAGSGTAFSPDQARQIMRFTSNITLMYDGDAAGHKATLAVIPVYLAEGANLRIISLPEGEDPDSFVPTIESSKLKQTLSGMEQDVVDYIFSLRKDEMGDVYKKEATLTEIGSLLSLIENNGIKNDLLKKAAILFKVGMDVLAPKAKAKTAVPDTENWKCGFYGVEEAKGLSKKKIVSLTFDDQTFINNYDTEPYILAKGAIEKHHIQAFRAAIHKCRIEESKTIHIQTNGEEPAAMDTLKEMFRHGVEIEIERTGELEIEGEDQDESEKESNVFGFVDYYVRWYGLMIKSTSLNVTESIKAKYIDRCAEIISCADNTVRTVMMKTYAKQLQIGQSDLKTIIQPYLNRKKDKATLESQRLDTESDLLEFDPEKIPSYVTEDKNLLQIYQRDRFYPLLKKVDETTQLPVSYMFRNEKGGGHTCISDFYMVPLLHIKHKDSVLNKRVIQLNHMHMAPRYVEWQSSFMANLGKLNEKFIEEGSYNFDGTMNQWKAIWRNMSYQFTACTELRTFGQQIGENVKDHFWAFTNAILHEVEGEMKVDYTNKLGVATHNGENYYSPAFSEIFAHQRNDDDQYELDRFFIYKEPLAATSVDFKEWAHLMNQVYKINDNGKWAVLFSMLSCFRDFIFSHTRFFTTLFFIGPTGSGKSQVAFSMRSLFMSPDAPVFNLNSGTDAAFFMLLERNRNVLSIMEEYNDNQISPVKFQGLKSSVLDGQGRTKIKDMNSKTLDSSKINAVPLILGQEAPQQDDGSLSNRTIICDVPYNPNGEFTQDEKDLFAKLKSHEKTSLCNVLVEVLSLRRKVKEHYIAYFNEEVKRINTAIRINVSNNEGLDRVINSVAMISAMCRFVETETELELPFTYAAFFEIACDKVLRQMETISSSNKLSTYFNTISFLINQGSLTIDKELKVVTPKGGKVTVMRSGKTETIQLDPVDTKVLYLNFEAIYPLYARSNSKDAMTRLSLKAYFESNKAFIGLCKMTKFIWHERKDVPRTVNHEDGTKTLAVEQIMDKKEVGTSAYMFRYDVLKELMGVDFERIAEETEAEPGQFIPETPKEDSPF